MHIFHGTNYNFLRWRWHAVILSWIVIIAGMVTIATKGIPRAIEFAGGTSVIVEFEKPTTVDAVRRALNSGFPGGGSDAIVQSYGDPARNQVLIRVPTVGGDQGADLTRQADAVESALKKGNLGNLKIGGTEVVHPSVGNDLAQKGLWAFFLSLAAILGYIAYRFQLSFAVGAVVATIHDVLVTLAFLAFFQYDFSLNVIAAILTVTGYSTNDTIVIFDRVRENLRLNRREPLHDVINRALNQTLGRTVITAGTAFLSAIALFLFGGEVLHGFAFTMLVGIVTGTYSSVFVAAAIVTFWTRKKTRPAVAAAEAPAVASRSRSKQKNTRAAS
jgi:preprotein translocase subunit SecF